jgi:hypothetical protein
MPKGFPVSDHNQVSATTDVFERLRAAVLQQNLSGEFPSWLVAEVLEIAGRPDRYRGKAVLVERLIAQIADYDPYAGAGCFGGAVSAGAIQATLRELDADR